MTQLLNRREYVTTPADIDKSNETWNIPCYDCCYGLALFINHHFIGIVNF